MRCLLFSLGLVMLAPLATFAAGEFFVIEQDPAWTQDGRSYLFRMRDGSPAPAGLRVQPLAGAVTNQFPAPVPTVARHRFRGVHAYGVATPATIRECRNNTAVMGSDHAHQGYPAGPGCVSTFIEGDDDWCGCIRAFSAKSIAAAAYYGDTEARLLDTLGEFNDTWNTTAFPINTVNPAYRGLQFDVFPVLTEDGGVTGSVNTTAAGGNNLLDNSQIVVTYSLDDGATWRPLDEFVISGDGDLRGTCGKVGLPLVRIEGLSPRAGLPNSGAGVTPIPEPAAAVAVVYAAWLFVQRAARRGVAVTQG